MSHLLQELRDFVAENKSSSLSDFIKKNIHLFANHEFTNKEKMRQTMRNSFATAFKESYPKEPLGDLENDSDILKHAFFYNKVTSQAVRDLLFQWFYIRYENEDDAELVQKNKQVIDQFETMKTSNPKTLLDKMSLQLLRAFGRLTPNEKNVLKLSLSYVVDLTDENQIIYKKYIADPLFWELFEAKAPQEIELIEEEEKKKIEQTCKKIIEAAEKGVDSAIKEVLSQQLELVKKKQRKSCLYQILQTFSFLLHNFENWEKKSKNTEAEKVCKINEILQIIFSDTCLTTQIGETMGNDTKEVCSLNEYNYSGSYTSSFSKSKASSSHLSPSSASSSSSYGRKIDLLVANEDGDELAFCEFKANNSKTLIQHQHSKSLRLNQQIIMKMKRSSVDEQLIYFNWEGSFGRFVVLEEKNGIYCSRPSSALSVPHNILQLDDDTIKAFINLFSWKKHLLMVNKKLIASSNKPERQDVGVYPNTCFTIVNKKRKFRQ